MDEEELYKEIITTIQTSTDDREVQRAYAILEKKLRPIIGSVGRKLPQSEQADFAQQAMLKCLKAVKIFDLARTRNGKYFESFHLFHQCARRALCIYFKHMQIKRSHVMQHALSTTDDIGRTLQSPDPRNDHDHLDQMESATMILKLLKTVLSKREFRAFVLVELQGYSYAAAGAKMKISSKSIDNLDFPTFRGRLLILFTRLPRTIRG